MATRTISFGFSDIGAATIVIKRASDDYYWDGSAWSASAPSSALNMTYDSVLQQYYSETAPTSRAFWTAFDSSGVAFAYNEYGGGFPEVADAGSASAYTAAEVLSRARVFLRDTDSNLWTDADLLAILDECNEWLINQCLDKKANIGDKKVVYTGDGTAQWGLPSDFLGLRNIVYPSTTYGGELLPRTKADYDVGVLALNTSYPTYYIIDQTNKLYFIPDLATGTAVNMYYYGRPTKLTTSTSVPYDGLFMNLMVNWIETRALKSDEFSATFETAMLEQFMRKARNHIAVKSKYSRKGRVRKRLYINNHRGKLT